MSARNALQLLLRFLHWQFCLSEASYYGLLLAFGHPQAVRLVTAHQPLPSVPTSTLLPARLPHRQTSLPSRL